MAHAKAKSTTKLGRDSAAKRLGVKLFDGERVRAGEIIVRQRGTRIYPGAGVRLAGDDTLYAAYSGIVKFGTKKKLSFNGKKKIAKIVSVIASP